MAGRTKIPLLVFRDNGAFAPNAQVVVNSRATGTQANVYPTETSGVAMTQPLVADARGRVPGWVDRGAYEAVISGVGVTAYTEQFDSAPGSAGTVDRAWLEDAIINTAKMADQAITRGKLDPGVLPLGTILEWWRPANSISLPAGYVEAKGQTLVAGTHDFPLAGSITLPDLRGRRTIGADSDVADGTSSTDASGNPRTPGIGGTGGDNARRTVTISIPGHYHSRGTLAISASQTGGSDRDLNHTHGNTGGESVDHAHGTPGTTPYSDQGWAKYGMGSGGYGGIATNGNVGGWSGTYGRNAGHVHGTGWMDRGIDHLHGAPSISQSGSIGATGSGVNGDAAFSSSTTLDMRSAHMGVLKLVKVRNA